MFNGNLDLGGNFSIEAFNPNSSFGGTINLGGNFAPEIPPAAPAAFDGGIGLDGDLLPSSALVLIEPSPITTTVSADAFANQRYANGGGRLFINNALVPFISAEINAPAGSLGKSLRIELASANRAQLPNDAAFRFQIGKIVAGAPVWKTILDGGKLEGKQFSMSVNRDSLNFFTFETNSKLNKFPKNNLIVFDAARSQVSAGEIEPIPTNTNEFVGTETRSVSVLTLYKLLDIAFVEGCGFASVQKDLPNYEIARCDFNVTNSYHDAIKQFIGMYEPDLSVAGDVLTIQKTIDPLPAGFTPNPLHASHFPTFTENTQNSAPNLDGYILQYTAGSGSFYVDRNLPDEITPSGTFGTSGFIETTVRRKMRDWFETGSAVPVRSELKEEIRETRRGGILVGRETKINKFDRLGRSAGYTNTVEARMPDVALGGSPALLKTREESQKIAYQTNPFAPRSTVLNRIETGIKGLLAVDAENTALDENGSDAPYDQDYEKVYEAGNLKVEMTSRFAALETRVEHFRPLANGQIEVRLAIFDALRGKLKPAPPSEVRSGDISVANFARQKTLVIFKAGINQANRTGELKTINVGELPFVFAERLVQWLLENPRDTASIEIAGYDESIERGVSFALKGRTGEDLGKFLTRGYRVLIAPSSIKTILDALKV